MGQRHLGRGLRRRRAHGRRRADSHQGGAGFDVVSYRGSGSVTADLTGAVQTGDAIGDTFSGIEGLIGSLGNDTLYGDGGDNTFTSMSGTTRSTGGEGSIPPLLRHGA